MSLAQPYIPQVKFMPNKINCMDGLVIRSELNENVCKSIAKIMPKKNGCSKMEKSEFTLSTCLSVK